ncbi:hypothetical protein [Chryseobacterium sp. POL2]|uniref:hypothetical protein n=1 Tax=Chryseobacterium sp. POL2 TaxID=2713414 RepID=UPI0013E1B28A|nr:hypothetical protein [Chryseobacterium sp. POL2]QIG88643.1 hypothetical protein G6R40_02715 [Chryseobacterium sp. POL2]
MKEIFNIFLIILIFIGCKQTENKNTEIDNKKNKFVENKFVPKYGNSFFNFDVIEYYHTKIPEDKAMDLFDSQNKSQIDKLKFDIIIGEKPENLNNLKFITSLSEIGFTRSQIPQSKFKEINQIFTEKTVYENYAAACVAVYRDILVFKKNKKIIGFCKICFDCRLFRIIGTNANTENFGQDGDFEKLSNLLKN